MQYVNNRGRCVNVPSMWDLSAPCAQFFCKPKASQSLLINRWMKAKTVISIWLKKWNITYSFFSSDLFFTQPLCSGGLCLLWNLPANTAAVGQTMVLPCTVTESLTASPLPAPQTSICLGSATPFTLFPWHVPHRVFLASDVLRPPGRSTVRSLQVA